jgi:hypothetical protein
VLPNAENPNKQNEKKGVCFGYDLVHEKRKRKANNNQKGARIACVVRPYPLPDNPLKNLEGYPGESTRNMGCTKAGRSYGEQYKTITEQANKPAPSRKQDRCFLENTYQNVGRVDLSNKDFLPSGTSHEALATGYMSAPEEEVNEMGETAEEPPKENLGEQTVVQTEENSKESLSLSGRPWRLASALSLLANSASISEGNLREMILALSIVRYFNVVGEAADCYRQQYLTN